MIKKSIKSSLCLSFIYFLLMPSLSYADLTGKDLLENCEVKIKVDAAKPSDTVDPTDAFQGGACTGYLKGFDDMEIIYSSILAGPSANEAEIKKYSIYCLTPGTTNLQMAKTIIQYLKEHPNELDTDGGIVVAKALRASYPCPKSTKPSESTKPNDATTKAKTTH